MAQAVLLASADAYLSSGANAATNFGSSTSLICGRVTSITNRPILRFDADDLPYFVDVTSAELATTIASDFSTTQDYTVRAVTLDSWVEGTVTYNTPWATAGGDYSATNEAETSIASTDLDFDVSDMVEAWVADGANFGFLIFGAETGTSDYITLAARDYATAGDRPTLTINYTLPPVVERIARSFKRRLAQVTTGNGYSLTLDVERPARRGTESIANGKCVLVQAPEAQKVGQVDGNPAAVEWRQEFYITIHVSAADDDTTPVDTVANAAAAAAELAITTEQLSGDWAQFDGLAIESEQTGRDIQFDGETATVRLAYAVIYRHSENDPYTVR